MYERRINYDNYFEVANKDKLWKNLYGLRSDIAHGNIIKFKEKYKLLKSRDNVEMFLLESVKNLLLLALSRPEFLSDLKKC